MQLRQPFTMNRLILLFVIVFSVSSLSACTLAKMALPRPLQGQSQGLAVALDRGPVNESVSFGTWRTTEVDRSWTTRIGAGIKFGGVGMAHESADQPYTFTLTKGKHLWGVECVTRYRNKASKFGPLTIRKGTTRIRCVAVSTKDERRIEIASMMVGSGHVGVIGMGENWIGLHTEHALTTGQHIGSAAGYSLRKDGEMLAAVQTINDREVWMRSGLKDNIEGPVAVTIASILLYRKVEATAERLF